MENPSANDTNLGTFGRVERPCARISDNASFNFKVAKGASIIMVVIGHFGVNPNLWVLATVGLFIFGFSSAFFTASIYDERFSFTHFWRKKIHRLAPSLLVINVFLLVVFICQRKPGIVTWQTLVNVIGFTGVLNWFSLPNPSPFGAGLWFFTLLLIFYAIYPLLRLVSRSRAALAGLGVLSLLACWSLQCAVPMGHMLWLTAWSFVFGLVVYRFNPAVPASVCGVSAVATAIVLLALNIAWDVKQANFILIIAISGWTVLWLKAVQLPRRLLSPVRVVASCVIEIYFLHMYLFVRPTQNNVINLVLSLCLITLVSLLLSVLASRIRSSRI